MPLPDFKRAWRSIVPIAATPTQLVDSEDVGARTKLIAELEQFARGREIVVDSDFVSPRPREFETALQAVNAHTQSIEFVAGFEDGTFWATTEEEGHWCVFTGTA